MARKSHSARMCFMGLQFRPANETRLQLGKELNDGIAGVKNHYLPGLKRINDLHQRTASLSVKTDSAMTLRPAGGDAGARQITRRPQHRTRHGRCRRRRGRDRIGLQRHGTVRSSTTVIINRWMLRRRQSTDTLKSGMPISCSIPREPGKRFGLRNANLPNSSERNYGAAVLTPCEDVQGCCDGTC
jgi:hypothetical protein